MSDIAEEMKKAQECAQIIKFQPDGKKVSNLQQARTEPNERLKRVFGIDNIFTNAIDSKRPFIDMVEKLMWRAMKTEGRTEDGDWSDLCHQATTFFKEYLERPETDTIRLAGLTQYMVLKLSLCYLFEGASEALATSETHFDDTKYIGRRINELWIESKRADGAQLPEWKEEEKLHVALRRATSASQATTAIDPMTPKQNPMNLLLPAYETMWRVVLRCFLEVGHRDVPSAAAWIATMRGYVEDLRHSTCTPNQAFHKETTTNGKVRPAEIVKEALRLYPPTRRVHRSFDGKQVAANFEECHRFEILGGSDPSAYRPERWQTIAYPERQKFYEQAARPEEDGAFVGYKKAKDGLKAAEEKLGYMPFAYFCAADHPATKEFASKMIALLVGVLCEGLDGGWELEHAASLPEMGVPLDSDRAAYEDLKLRRKG
ncbi:cytochrome p450 [Stemphylium lycopersici]|uniref:Cytochrome p450 n=1 Tax=Stemphylium lycopersici TaxID=183478 RepID=A0A364MTT7_STELY|nr:cytochrome p450 [Stemphylium lycopersici]RAR03225.1 cytochrome p450 [Stemphylium lycopersici]